MEWKQMIHSQTLPSLKTWNMQSFLYNWFKEWSKRNQNAPSACLKAVAMEHPEMLMTMHGYGI